MAKKFEAFGTTFRTASHRPSILVAKSGENAPYVYGYSETEVRAKFRAARFRRSGGGAIEIVDLREETR